MTFKERIDNEKNNLERMFLYYDRGLFFSLVERSAYAFHTRIKPFKANIKSLKGLHEPYVTLGFPVNKKDEYLNGLSYEDDGQGCITVKLDEPIDENAFQAWKKHIMEQNLTVHKNEDNNSLLRQCLLEVQTLNIAAMTPMDAIMFLNSLQVKLKNVKL